MSKLHYNVLQMVDECFQLVTFFDENGFADVEEIDRQIDEILKNIGPEDEKKVWGLNKQRQSLLQTREYKIPTVMLRDFVYPRRHQVDL